MEYNAKQLEIINIAEKLFAKQGFAGTSVRDISQEAEMNVSMISYYFGSKDKLIEAVFAVRAESFIQQLETLRATSELFPLQKVMVMIDLILERLVEKKCFHNIMLREQLSGENRNPIVTSVVQGIKLNHFHAIENIIKDGQEQGELRKGVDIMMLYTTLLGAFNQAISTMPLYRKVYNLENLSESEQEAHMLKTLNAHLKTIFKCLLA